MWYEKEYTFFKKLAEYFRFPVQEIKATEFFELLKKKIDIVVNVDEKTNVCLQRIAKNCPEEKIICFQDKNNQYDFYPISTTQV